mmetsp:Transcript_6161/g.17687  ORF Transcript_6161/g.17687 Transcript_6161/m.17687 type:complete len:204 (+) Transcript_6161:2636-3247(+)
MAVSQERRDDEVHDAVVDEDARRHGVEGALGAQRCSAALVVRVADAQPDRDADGGNDDVRGSEQEIFETAVLGINEGATQRDTLDTLVEAQCNGQRPDGVEIRGSTVCQTHEDAVQDDAGLQGVGSHRGVQQPASLHLLRVVVLDCLDVRRLCMRPMSDGGRASVAVAKVGTDAILHCESHHQHHARDGECPGVLSRKPQAGV